MRHDTFCQRRLTQIVTPPKIARKFKELPGSSIAAKRQFKKQLARLIDQHQRVALPLLNSWRRSLGVTSRTPTRDSPAANYAKQFQRGDRT
jgi:hypothetical protein